jgi:tRNASer (uridine44-2'-O)-methyltransferase
MTTPPTVQTPPYKPSKPSISILPNLETPYQTPCHFTLPTFLHVLKDLTLHPERNSSLILRADPIPLDTQSQVKSTELEDVDEEFEDWIKENEMEKVEDIRVRLMPKQPKRDGKLDQRVLFYRSKEVMGHEHDLVGETAVERGVVVMLPLVKRVEDIPFFHPPVRKLVFYYESQVGGIQPTEEDQMVEGMKYLSTAPEGDDTAGPAMETPEIQGRISISFLPFPSLQSSTPLPDPKSTSTMPGLAVRRTESRLDRTCLALLERVYKHGFGSMVGYKKRVNHDVRNTLTKVDRSS